MLYVFYIFTIKQVDAIIRKALYEVGSNFSASNDDANDISNDLMNNIQQVSEQDQTNMISFKLFSIIILFFISRVISEFFFNYPRVVYLLR